MDFGYIFWPWGRIKMLQIIVKALAHIRETDAMEIAQLKKDVAEAQLRIKNAAVELTRLRGKLAQAHFRDPKTGRISKKGQSA